MSILTFKIKHNRDFSKELYKAGRIARFALRTHSRSSKDVKQFGIPSSISNQILKKYSANKKAKKLSSVKLTIPSQGIKLLENKVIKISCLKLELNYNFNKEFSKINQIELDNKYAYVSVKILDKPEIKVENYLGVDRNTTGHCAVVAMPHTGKVYKLGKKAFHIHRKYKKIRQHLQKVNAKRMLKKIRRRESNIIKDINHKISRKIVELAIQNNCGIKLEKLEGIRKNNKRRSRKVNKNGESFQSSINTWEFYQLQSMIEYKSKICGIPVVFVDPHYTSQRCSRCKAIGIRNQKKFSCPCGHVDHADANAGFNIALASSCKATEGNDQLLIDRSSAMEIADNDINKGSTDTPHLETQRPIEAVA